MTIQSPGPASSPALPQWTAYAIVALAPLFFSTNVIFGRGAQDIAPFTLAALRWGLTAAILLLATRREWPQAMQLAREQWRLLLICGFFGMWICGGAVYWALKHTTATNGTLIYTLPPVLILLLERFFRGRPIAKREMGGIALAFCGVAFIVARGSLANLAALDFNIGDLVFLGAAASWAVYSVLIRAKALQGLSVFATLGLLAAFGALTLLPFAALEIAWSSVFPASARQWQIIAGIVALSSLAAFSTFQHGVRELGPTVTGIFMYLLAPCGVLLSFVFLGERLAAYHLPGMALVLAGVITATWPGKR